MRRFIFFDIDGTLVKDEYYCVPSAVEAVRKLKENGHIVGIASGRQLSTILPIAKVFGIENIVSDGGYGVMIHNQILHIEPLEKEIVEALCKECEEKHIAYALMLDSKDEVLYANKAMHEQYSSMSFEGIPVVLKEDLHYSNRDVYKVFMKIPLGKEYLITSMDLTRINRYEDDGLVVEPDDKFKGVKEIVEYFHGDRKDIVFFGDGYNDLKMFDEDIYRIAMGNGIEELKQKADFVTKSIDEDGIMYACKKMGWI